MNRILRILSICSLLVSLPALAALGSDATSSTSKDDEPMHFGADQSKLNRKTRLIELRGNAYLMRENEELHADEIDLDQETHQVHARGRVRYQYMEYFIRADQVYLDLKNKTGTVINGNLTNGLFALRGAKMDQLSPGHFLVKDYDYTTCLDCPNSWELLGKDVDITIEGYAYIKDFIFKIKDASFFWLPYMIVPIKSKRQTGFLFPRFGVNDAHGAYLVEPFYWATNDWSDMTLGAGSYFKRGTRLEWEGRYAITPRSQGVANYYFTQDTSIPNINYRYATKVAITQELPWGIEGKLRVNEISDSGYPITYLEDVPGRYEPALSSDLFFSKDDPQMSTVVSLRRIRNLLYFDQTPNQNFIPGFDTNTVQDLPRLVVNTNDQFLFGSKVAAGLEARFDRFARYGDPFDHLSLPEVDSSGNVVKDVNGNPVLQNQNTIREANRLSLVPKVYTTINPWPWLSLVPSVEYHSFLYSFNNAPGYPALERGYLLAQLEASVQLEKMYNSSDPNVTYKHTIRPSITYSRIPIDQETSNHPFITQVQNTAAPGQYFDNSDISPIKVSQNLSNYFTPLGDSMTYGIVSQFFKKERTIDGAVKVSKLYEAGVSQTLDLQQAQEVVAEGQPDRRIILSPLFSYFLVQQDKFSMNTQYTYYSYLDHYDPVLAQLVGFPDPHQFSTSMAWTWEHAVHNGLMMFDRSISLSYSFSKLTAPISYLHSELHYSINDYIMPKVSGSWNLVENSTYSVLDYLVGLTFQSPSRCWQIDTGVTWSVDNGHGFALNFAMNLTGSSYGTADAATNH